MNCAVCGKFDGEAKNEAPDKVKVFGMCVDCAKTETVETRNLRAEVERLKSQVAVGRHFYAEGPDCKRCGKPTANGTVCFFCGQDQGEGEA